MRGKVLVLLCGLMAVVLAPPARAVDPNTDGWEFRAAPYIWAVSLDGDMTVKGNTVAIDAPSWVWSSDFERQTGTGRTRS